MGIFCFFICCFWILLFYLFNYYSLCVVVVVQRVQRCLTGKASKSCAAGDTPGHLSNYVRLFAVSFLSRPFTCCHLHNSVVLWFVFLKHTLILLMRLLSSAQITFVFIVHWHTFVLAELRSLFSHHNVLFSFTSGTSCHSPQPQWHCAFSANACTHFGLDVRRTAITCYLCLQIWLLFCNKKKKILFTQSWQLMRNPECIRTYQDEHHHNSQLFVPILSLVFVQYPQKTIAGSITFVVPKLGNTKAQNKSTWAQIDEAQCINRAWSREQQEVGLLEIFRDNVRRWAITLPVRFH